MWLPGSGLLLVVAACCLALGASAGFWVARSADMPAQEQPLYARLEPLHLPMINSAGEVIGSTALTIALVVPDPHALSRVRALVPRLRDRLLSDLGQRTDEVAPTLSGEGLTALRNAIAGIARTVVGPELVSEALITEALVVSCPTVTRHTTEPRRAAPSW